MAEDIGTLAGLVQINDMNNVELEVSDLLQDAPLIAALVAVPASNGTNHSYTKETVAEGVGFREVNAGVTNTNSSDLEVESVLKPLDASFDVDTALARKARGGSEAYIAKRIKRKLKAAMFALESQIIYGTGAAAGGFAGLFDNAALDGLSDGMVIEPGTPGTTVGGQTSVIFIRSTEDDTAFVAGNDGEIIVDDPVIQRKVVDPGTDNKVYGAFFTNIVGWGGIQYGSAFSVARIANVETSLTGDDMSKALALFPSNRQPNVIAMNRQALELWRKSRTAVNTDGTEAPRPNIFEGIPVISTDSLLNTEAIVA